MIPTKPRAVASGGGPPRAFCGGVVRAAALFVIGFSCRDEHIRELMVRAARTNPTLQIVIFAYSPHAAGEIEQAFDGYPITNSGCSVGRSTWSSTAA